MEQCQGNIPLSHYVKLIIAFLLPPEGPGICSVSSPELWLFTQQLGAEVWVQEKEGAFASAWYPGPG